VIKPPSLSGPSRTGIRTQNHEIQLRKPTAGAGGSKVWKLPAWTAGHSHAKSRNSIEKAHCGGGGLKSLETSGVDRVGTSREFPQISENFFSASCTRHLQTNQPGSDPLVDPSLGLQPA
jgi:hypothetical protein